MSVPSRRRSILFVSQSAGGVAIIFSCLCHERTMCNPLHLVGMFAAGLITMFFLGLLVFCLVDRFSRVRHHIPDPPNESGSTELDTLRATGLARRIRQPTDTLPPTPTGSFNLRWGNRETRVTTGSLENGGQLPPTGIPTISGEINWSLDLDDVPTTSSPSSSAHNRRPVHFDRRERCKESDYAIIM